VWSTIGGTVERNEGNYATRTRFESASLPKSGAGCTLVSDKWAGAHFFVGDAEFGCRGRPVIVLELHPVARKIADLIEPHLQRQGFELIAVEFKQGSRGAMLRLLVDKPGGGITLDDLERLSPVLSDLLDVYDPIESRYLLEVASPGINRPLIKLEHFEEFVGKKVKVRTHMARNGSKSFIGKLAGVTRTGIELNELSTPANGAAEHRETFTFEEIHTAHYEHDFDEGKRRPASRHGARS
jgi:ribosome maturation factor RimP